LYLFCEWQNPQRVSENRIRGNEFNEGLSAGLRDAVKDTDGTPDSPENMEKVLNVMQSGMDGSMLVDTSIRMLATCIYRYDVKTQRPIPGPVGIEVIQEWPEEIINELVAEADKRVAITQTPAKNS